MTIITGLKNPPTLLMADQNQSLLKKLPKDVLLKLLSFLPIQSIEMFSQTCQSFNVVLQNNHFWWSLFNSRMPAPIPEGTCYEVEFYKSALKNQYLLLNGGYTSQLIEGIIYSVIVADGKLIMGNRDGTITIRDLKSLEWIGTLTGHTEAVSTLFWDDNNKKLISSSEDRTIKFWDLQSGKCTRTHKESIEDPILADGKLISSSYNEINIWDFKNNCSSTLNALSTTSLLCAGQNHLIRGLQGGAIYMLDLSSGEHLGILSGHESRVCSLLMAGENLISGSYDNTIKIWDLKSGQCVRTLELETRVCGLSLAGGNIISVSADNMIRIWDFKSGQCVRTIEVSKLYHHPTIWADGKLILQTENGIKILDFTATNTQILEQIARLFRSSKTPGDEAHNEAMELFARMPKAAKIKIYELYKKIRPLANHYYEGKIELAFQDQDDVGHEDKAQAIETYLNAPPGLVSKT